MSLKRLTLTIIVVTIITGMAWALGNRIAEESLDGYFGPRRGAE